MKHKKSMGIVLSLLAFGVVSCSNTTTKTNIRATPKAKTVVAIPTPTKARPNTCQHPMYKTLKLQWSNAMTLYKGTMNLNGCQGSLMVSFWDSIIGKTATVQQSIRVADSSMGVMLYGYNPVYPQTSKKYPTYAADNFLFQRRIDGTEVTYVCDDAEQCSSVQVSQ